MKWIVAPTIGVLMAICGCSPASRSPDAIRQNTANATAAAARDTKAMAQGVFEGLRAKGPLNINRATKDQLENLPGITGPAADRIIAARPYQNSAELVHRRILSKAEYNRIAGQVVAR
jgi:DNA uptake protein ComE-like DNA-binding protein